MKQEEGKLNDRHRQKKLCQLRRVQCHYNDIQMHQGNFMGALRNLQQAHLLVPEQKQITLKNALTR